MKLKKTPLAAVSLRYGVMAGVIATAMVAALYYLGQHPLLISPYFDYRIILFGIFIFFALKELRDQYQGGVLFFWQGMVGSYMISFLATTLGALGVLAMASWEPRFTTDYIAAMTEYLRAFPEADIERIGRDVYERNLTLLSSTDAKTLAISYFGQGILLGFFISIVLSVILRKQPKTP